MIQIILIEKQGQKIILIDSNNIDRKTGTKILKSLKPKTKVNSSHDVIILF